MSISSKTYILRLSILSHAGNSTQSLRFKPMPIFTTLAKNHQYHRMLVPVICPDVIFTVNILCQPAYKTYTKFTTLVQRVTIMNRVHINTLLNQVLSSPTLDNQYVKNTSEAHMKSAILDL